MQIKCIPSTIRINVFIDMKKGALEIIYNRIYMEQSPFHLNCDFFHFISNLIFVWNCVHKFQFCFKWREDHWACPHSSDISWMKLISLDEMCTAFDVLVLDYKIFVSIKLWNSVQRERQRNEYIYRNHTNTNNTELFKIREKVIFFIAFSKILFKVQKNLLFSFIVVFACYFGW